ncbi:MAG: xanthine dehydrogenase family protein [Alphaproteobacteria bacterium]|nr:xanthine dehydrogenase family protein [Alphaproteobacteria bacterium]
MVLTVTTRWLGKSVKRVEDHRLLTGHGRFVDDISLPSTLHTAFVRCPFPRAEIAGIDVSAAKSRPDIVAVYTGADVAGLGHLPVNRVVPDMNVPRFSVLARHTAMAVGEAVTAVVATTRAAAAEGADLVDVDYRPLEPVLDHVTAHEHDPLFDGIAGNRAIGQSWQQGDVAAALESSDFVVRTEVDHPRLAPVSLESRAVLASGPDSAAAVTVWLSTQTPHRARTDLAAMIGLSEEQVRVIAPDVGGAFGMKASLYPEEILVVWASLQLDCPVKWIATRSEDLLSASHGRGARSEATMGLTKEGRVTALRARITHPLGHWLPYSAAVPAWNSGRILPGPYAVDAIDVESRSVLTNTAPVGIYRGAGRPEAAMILERLFDRAARETGIDPLELRRRNLIASDSFPYETATGETLDSGDYAGVLDRAGQLANYPRLRDEQSRRRAAGELVGVGVGMYVEPCGRGFESATVSLERSGRFVVATGTSAQGQGRETAFAQIAADVLAVPLDRIEVRHGDTATTPRGIGALASRSTAIGGGALVRAAEAVRDRGAAVAARLLQSSVAEIVACDGGFGVGGDPKRRVPWRSVAEEAAGIADGADAEAGEAISSTVTFTVPGEAWAAGCCIAKVAIDAETGGLAIERLAWVDDAGAVINPMLVAGQLIGGIAQGVGEAMMERMVYDADGQLLSGSLMDYAVPRAADMPPVSIDHTTTPSPNNPLGAKGVGEAGPIGAPAAILNAALDALAPLGIDRLDMPLTNATIWQAISTAAAKERS